jgi:hypothetical protein
MSKNMLAACSLVFIALISSAVGLTTTNYEQAGPDFDPKLKVFVKTVTTYGAGGKVDSKKVYGIEGIEINSHVIKLLSNEVTSSQKVFTVETKDYGLMKIEVLTTKESGGTNYKFILYMTPEQKKFIKDLDTK